MCSDMTEKRKEPRLLGTSFSFNPLAPNLISRFYCDPFAAFISLFYDPMQKNQLKKTIEIEHISCLPTPIQQANILVKGWNPLDITSYLISKMEDNTIPFLTSDRVLICTKHKTSYTLIFMNIRKIAKGHGLINRYEFEQDKHNEQLNLIELINKFTLKFTQSEQFIEWIYSKLKSVEKGVLLSFFTLNPLFKSTNDGIAASMVEGDTLLKNRLAIQCSSTLEFKLESIPIENNSLESMDVFDFKEKGDTISLFAMSNNLGVIYLYSNNLGIIDALRAPGVFGYASISCNLKEMEHIRKCIFDKYKIICSQIVRTRNKNNPILIDDDDNVTAKELEIDKKREILEKIEHQHQIAQVGPSIYAPLQYIDLNYGEEVWNGRIVFDKLFSFDITIESVYDKLIPLPVVLHVKKAEKSCDPLEFKHEHKMSVIVHDCMKLANVYLLELPSFLLLFEQDKNHLNKWSVLIRSNKVIY